ncbi:cytochrome c maturation protein CcmE [Neisseria iguanae]|uniref:Cytochrome c-type biogenesis protein CcmE n=1 Tax=Neisseria iguanae TaxID=90242 RepID=A0A2P7U0F7_9NEIS|nr:cytochrome c maturation protein CcmE [Neisseria iguanae]
MGRPYQKRLFWGAGALVALASITIFVVQALRENLVFFYTPTQVLEGAAEGQKNLRIGGMVVPGSLQRTEKGVHVHFSVSDGTQSLPVTYQGTLPDLFQEGKGAVADGQWDGEVFQARNVLAKHDENYVPSEAQEAVKAAHQKYNQSQSMPSLQ